jgi:hypothetical protein
VEVLFTYFHKATFKRGRERERDRERDRQSQGSPFNAITVYIRGHGFGVIDDLIDF